MKIDELINNTVEEYKQFMGIQKFPIILPQFSSDDRKSYAFVGSDDIRGEKVRLYYTKRILGISDNEIIATLYHELTHIYDAQTVFKNIKSNDIFIKSMSSYSEFHAEKISFMKSCGMSSVEDGRMFQMNSEILYRGEKRTLYDVSQNMLLRSIKQLNSIYDLSDMKPEKIKEIVKIVMGTILYYLGYLSFLQDYVQEYAKSDFSSYGEFSENILQLYDIMCIFDKTHNTSDFKKVIVRYQDLSSELARYFIQNYFTYERMQKVRI